MPVAYSMDLADRVRQQLAGVERVTEQEMFGGLSFLVAGHMCCGAYGDDLVVRIPPELHHDALVRPHTREMEMGTRAMRGLILVDREGLEDDADLNLWVRLGLARATALPPKAVKKRATVAKKAGAEAGRRAGPKVGRAAPRATKKAAAKQTVKTAAKSTAKGVPRTTKKAAAKSAVKTVTKATTTRALKATRKAVPAAARKGAKVTTRTSAVRAPARSRKTAKASTRR